MSRFASRLLNWYQKNKRILPWRDHRDPYVVWVSEIMLQQTRVETVLPYFDKWMKLFPTVLVLARATEQDVLNAWEGLGYYSRARNFHKAAKIVVEQHKGRLPRGLDELRKLPGIGRYTVGALASIVFGMDEPALDGNLKRVYARLFDVSEPVDSAEGESLLWKLARENLPRGRAADFNQALMDLGASICLPKNPHCTLCPVMKNCLAWENETQNIRPVRKPKKSIPQYVHAAAVFVRRIANPPHEEVLLVQRPAKGLLGGMWEFPNGRVGGDPEKELASVLKSGYSLRLRRKRNSGPMAIVHHTYSHFKVTVHAYPCELVSKPQGGGFKWILMKDLGKFPMGKIDRQISDSVIGELLIK